MTLMPHGVDSNREQDTLVSDIDTAPSDAGTDSKI